MRFNENFGIIELETDESLDEVVISATLKPVSKLNSPVPVDVYNQSFFKANPTSSIFEALNFIPKPFLGNSAPIGTVSPFTI